MKLWRVMAALGATWLVALMMVVGPPTFFGTGAQGVQAYGSNALLPKNRPPRDFKPLAAAVSADAQTPGLQLGVSLIELGGSNPGAWDYLGDSTFDAASTYKLPVLMAEGEGIARHTISGGDVLCFESDDYEGGYFQDYGPGTCFTRAELARRAGKDSDNTAGHILVRYLGGNGALNAYAHAHGAVNSAFFVGNTTTPNDLAHLWGSEATGGAGGRNAQAWLYPLLEQTAYERGVPAGVPGAHVAHKVGQVGNEVTDAALVLDGPHGAYVLVVCTSGLADAAWRVIARIASQVQAFEASRTA